MPLIQKPQDPIKKEQLRLRISNTIIDEVKAYCAWQDIDSIDYFVEQAMIYILEKDKEWKEYKSSLPI